MCGCISMLASLLLSYVMVLAAKNDIMAKVTKDSWMSMENFEILINASFSISSCCNIIMVGEAPGTNKLFNDFIKSYRYEYVIRGGAYDCSSYFMLSTSAASLVKELKKVPTANPTVELLVVIDDDVQDSITLFNASMYHNANVNIVAHNGMWQLTDKCLEQRIFRRVTRNHDMAHDRRIVNLHGQELQAAAYFKPPFCYLSTTVNRTVNGIEGEFFIAKNDSELDGVEMKLFMLMADILNFTWTIRKPTTKYMNGIPNGTLWYGGMIGQLRKKEIDIGFTSIFLGIDHYRFSNLTIPWTLTTIHFLVPRPKPYTSFWSLTRTLSPEVWSVVIATLIFQSVNVYARAWVNPRIPKRFRSFAITWTEMMGRLIGTGAPTLITGLELQFQLWNFISILIVTAYSSSLAANLASTSFEKRIDTPQDFLKANLTWGSEIVLPKNLPFFNPAVRALILVCGIPIFCSIITCSSIGEDCKIGEVARTAKAMEIATVSMGQNLEKQKDPYATRIRSRFEFEENEAGRHKKIMNGNYAVFGRSFGSYFHPLHYIRNEDLQGYRLMKHEFDRYYVSFIVKPCLLESVDKVMLRLVETGLTTYHLGDVLHRRTGLALREVLVERDGLTQVAKVLQLTSLGAAFFILILGHSISTIIFYLEVKSVNVSRSIGDTLLEMKRKREIWQIEKLDR